MCSHPPEEQQRVFEGAATPRPDRMFCGLCGELVYLTRPSAVDAAAPAVPDSFFEAIPRPTTDALPDRRD